MTDGEGVARALGVLAGEIELGPDFDAPLPDFDEYTK